MALSAALVLTFTATGTSYAQQAPHETAQQVDRVDRTDLADASAPATATSAFPAEAGEHCEPTRPGSKERRAGAVEACVSTSPTPARRSSIQPLATGTCAITSPGKYSYERFSYCVNGVNVTYILRDSNGKEIGRGTLEISTSATLPKAETTWSEHVTATMTSATGDVTALNAKLKASCGSGCTATKYMPWYVGDVTLGKPLAGDIKYSSAPAAGAITEFTTSYQLYVTSPGATAVDPNASWSNPQKIRCDNAVGGTSTAGCVVPSVRAQVPLSTQGSDQGGAVAAYLWAQKNLSDRWGLDTPLTRAVSGVDDRVSSTCGSGASKPFADASDLIPTDTCAQFPFAETSEGGTDGARCAELIPNHGSGGWVIFELGGGADLDPSKRCVRAHVAAGDKEFADNQLRQGFVSQRVIDADPFMLGLTASLDGSHAECLGSSPAGARLSGNGWILNTTAPVPHVNTLVPSSPTGTRAAAAVACLGKTLGPGSEAGGDITGWQDAELYAQAHDLDEERARCHLIAKILGGRISDNLVPCWQVGTNTGAGSMWEFEKKVRDQVASDTFGPDDAILYQVTPMYLNATSTIPVSVTMSAKIERGDGSIEQLFSNVDILNTQDNGQYNLGN
ncbi:DNA/RNA non-specific endonuclease [Streptomyces sp. NPDC102406]|uniref:DNA/RNA non-specific endonuclease n=1 Tax=Streptomyces sp. NPDC102406 TaxID=3366171 RepID=UPI0037FC7405